MTARSTLDVTVVKSSLIVVSVWVAAIPVQAQWPHWGGANHNFKVDSVDLADEWPQDGPKQLWRRPIGHGYSAILVDDGLLYTMCSRGHREIVLALDAGTGKTVWEHEYDGRAFEGMDPRFGRGPRGTPLVLGDYVYAVGVGAIMHCLDKKTGKVIWSHNLADEYGATALFWGYASSPAGYKNTVIVPVGGKGHGVMAFEAKTGKVAWSTHDFKNAYSTPLIINLDGQDQLVVFVADEVVGLDPNNGKLLWRHPHETSYDVNASTPIWGEDDVLFLSSGYGTGARALKLSRQNDTTRVKELWRQRKMGIHFGTAIRIDDHVYASIGDNGPTFFAAINLKNGEISWRKRGAMAKASSVYADKKLIILDEDGNLALATASPEKLTIHSKTSVFDGRAWTAPTLVGNTLYLRDLKSILALQL